MLSSTPRIYPIVAAQFFGAVNDNLFKIVVSLFAANLGAASEATGTYLAIAGALFVLPYLMFSGYAGYLADAFSKRKVLIIAKLFEILVMALGLVALLSGRIEVMFAVLFLMATQSVFFSPAKYGLMPELLRARDLSRGNGLLEMATFIGIIIGTGLGGALFGAWKTQLQWIGILAIALAVIGALVSLLTREARPVKTRPAFSPYPWTEIRHGLAWIMRDRPLLLTVLAITYFYFAAGLLQLNIILLGTEAMMLEEWQIGAMQAILGIGIGTGSLAAGRISQGKVELGLVPLGAIGVVIGCAALALAPPSFYGTCVALAVVGFGGGLFILPLSAFLQQRSPADERGRIIATNNFLNVIGVLCSSAALWMLRSVLDVPAESIMLIVGLLTALATVLIIAALPIFLVRLILYLIVHTVYRIHVIGRENIPKKGPALLICNHVAFVDGLLINAAIQRMVRFIVSRRFYEMKLLNPLFRGVHAIPISPGRKRDVAAALEKARTELRNGHLVCIFPEGALSRTGAPYAFNRGMEMITKGTDAPIVPVHLDQVWGSIFSFKDGRGFWKWPRRLPYPVTVSFGNPLPAGTPAWKARLAVMELGSQAMAHRKACEGSLHRQFIRSAKRHWPRSCMVDSTGQDLNFGRSLVGSILLSKHLRQLCNGDRNVGVILPASVAGGLVNIALPMAGFVPVNLNITAGSDAMASAISQAGISRIITSRKFLAKANIPERDGLIFMEDLAASFSMTARLCALIVCRLLPAWAVGRIYRIAKPDPDDVATIMFTSGSTGEPKGVMLSHRNILSNVEAAAQILSINNDDKMMGVLPFFHSFGLTGTLWIPLLNGIGAIYHPNPLDAKSIGQMVAKHRATILISTPTFCRSYIKSCPKEQFSSLRLAVVGAEKLTEPVATAFRDKFGIELMEGYGGTEMSPVIAVNVPDVDDGIVHQIGCKPGTVGHPIPGVSAKTVDLETGRELGPDEEGMLLVSGPGRMLGYLNNPDKTAAVFKQDWYVTGDIAAIDVDGFVRITDRESRFSKIAGEMVPHGNIEQAVNQIEGVDDCLVTAVPDARKGERIVLFYTSAENQSVPAVVQALQESGLPKLWLPRQDSIHRLDELPLLPTGKADLRKARQLAMEMSG